MVLLLFIFILATPVLFAFKPAYSSIIVPSVPEFTLKFESHPYDVPSTYKIDPYTGKNLTDEEIDKLNERLENEY